MGFVRSPVIGRRLMWVAACVALACSSATDVNEVGSDSVATIVVNPRTPTVAVGGAVPLEAVVQDANGKTISGVPVVWTVQDSKVATVSSSGVVTGVAVGTTQVAANANGKSGIAAVTVQKTPVASVVVLPDAVELAPGGKTPLTGVAYDEAQNALSDRTITWTTSNAAVATVDAAGMVTAVAAGTATITGTAEGKSDGTIVTVKQAAVATVAVLPNPLSMSATQTTPMTAVARDADGAVLTGRPVAWSSSNITIATVTAQGVVTAVTAGSATITATVEGKTGTSALTVANFAVGSVNVQPQLNPIIVGGNTQLTAVVRDVTGALTTDRVVAWTSSNTAVATVSSTGVVTGVTVGVATITATSEGQSGTASVNVLPQPVVTVTVNPPTATITAGQTSPLAAVLKDANGIVLTGRIVAWSSSNTAVATVSATGVVSAVVPGTATITATSEGRSGTAAVTVTAVPVATVSILPAAPSVIIGQTAPLAATVKDASGAVLTGRVVTWGSSNTAIATVSATGVVTAVALGTATITATSEGKSGTVTVTVVPVPTVPVGSVGLSPPNTPLFVAQTSQLTVTVKDANGTVVTNRLVTWASNNTPVATVSATGVVTAVAPGNATITATSEGVNGTATVTVTLAPVLTVTVAPPNPGVVVAATTTLTATTKDADGNVVTGRVITWASSNTAIASVSAAGVVTGVAPGSVTITATSETKSGTSTVTVTPIPVATVTVTPLTASVTVGATTPLAAATKDATGAVLTGRVVTWGSGTPTVATVSAAGVVTGIAVGTSVITATSEGKSGTSTVTVTQVPVATVTVAPLTSSVIVGATTPLTATTRDAGNKVLTGRVVTWSSSNTAIATVSAAGVVTGVAAGSATITATSETKSGTATVTVTLAPVASVTVAPPTASVVVGGTTPLTATTTDAGGAVLTGRQITWSSNKTAIATVSASGVVTGVGAGAATITATSEGHNGTSAVTVTLAPVATVAVTPPTASVAPGGTTPLTAETKDAGGTVLTGRAVTWSSGTPTVATVSATGVVTGVAPGTSVITATSEGKVGTSTVTVTQVPVASVAIAAPPPSIFVAGTAQLTATTRDASGNLLTGRVVTWQSSDNNIATVSATGVVTGVAPGNATITATSEGQNGTAPVTIVLAPVATVTVAPPTASVVAGLTTALTPTLKDANGNVLSNRTITWGSSNTAVATVNAFGVVTGVAPGTATITATSEGQNGTSSITVTPAPPVPVGTVTVDPPSATLTGILLTTTLTATVKDANGLVVTDRAVAWSSSDGLIASVSPAGVVTGLIPGSATITATSEGKSGSSVITVTLPETASRAATLPFVASAVGK